MKKTCEVPCIAHAYGDVWMVWQQTHSAGSLRGHQQCWERSGKQRCHSAIAERWFNRHKRESVKKRGEWHSGAGITYVRQNCPAPSCLAARTCLIQAPHQNIRPTSSLSLETQFLKPGKIQVEQVREQTVNSCYALCLLRKGMSNKKVQQYNELSLLQEGVQGCPGLRDTGLIYL